MGLLYDDSVGGYQKSYARDDVPSRSPAGRTLPTLEKIDFKPGESVESCEEDVVTYIAEDLAVATNTEGNRLQTLASRLREHLQRIAEQRVPITYRELANALGLKPPHTIHQVTEALEHLMAEDAATHRPFIAAIAISRALGGLPAPGFFDCARRLGRFAGDEAGPEAGAFHAREFNAAVAYWAATATTGKSGV